MLVVGSRAEPTERVPMSGVGDGLYIYRLSSPPSGELTPVACAAVSTPNIARLVRGAGVPSASRGYALHVACETDAGSTYGKG
eukprot:1051177-Prymnesium_polylepis.1